MKCFNSPLQNDTEYAEAVVLVDEYQRRTGARSRMPIFNGKAEPKIENEEEYQQVMVAVSEYQERMIPGITKPLTFESALTRLINQHSMENESSTPDFILAKYLERCLGVFNATMKERSRWYGTEIKGTLVETATGRFATDPKNKLNQSNIPKEETPTEPIDVTSRMKPNQEKGGLKDKYPREEGLS
jgi:hypothetical protein